MASPYHRPGLVVSCDVGSLDIFIDVDVAVQ